MSDHALQFVGDSCEVRGASVLGQEIQHRKESEALLTANADLVELRALLAAIEPQAVRLKMLYVLGPPHVKEAMSPSVPLKRIERCESVLMFGGGLLRCREEENAELRKQQELAKKKEASVSDGPDTNLACSQLGLGWGRMCSGILTGRRGGTVRVEDWRDGPRTHTRHQLPARSVQHEYHAGTLPP